MDLREYSFLLNGLCFNLAPLSFVSSYSRGGVPKKRDFFQVKLGPDFKMTRLAWASAQSDPFLRNPNEGIVCQGCLKKGRKMGFCLFVVIWRILISRKLVPILWTEGV